MLPLGFRVSFLQALNDIIRSSFSHRAAIDFMSDKILDALVEPPSGEVAVTVVALADDDAQRGASWQEIADNPWALLGTIFFVMAILGIPLLWRSRVFSPFSKLIITCAVLAWTAFIFWLFWLVMLWSYNRIAASL